MLLLELFGKNDDTQRKKENEILEDLTHLMVAAENIRYTIPFVHYSVPRSQNFITHVLPFFDENRFKQIVRVSWTTFRVILGQIRNDEVFQGPRSCQQFPVEMQLIIVLYRLGSSGEGASVAKIARLFGIGDGGTLQIITNRIFIAILKLKCKFLYWPSATERKNLVSSTLNELPHCVGYVDGTEIKLAEKPTEDPESFFSRKHIYSLKVQALCDYRLKIRHMVLGYPGSVHDARIFNNSDLCMKVEEFLSGEEWLAGDSAYKLTRTVITPFRVNSTELTLQERNEFNKTFSRYRIRIEHCFGLLKERFNSLKELKIQIKNDSSIRKACHWILVCAILHNIILDQNEVQEISEVRNEILESNESDFYENLTTNHATVEGEVKRRSLLYSLK